MSIIGDGPYCIENRMIGGLAQLMGWDQWCVHFRFWDWEQRDAKLALLQKGSDHVKISGPPVRAEFRAKDDKV